jgi:hypothetical protein
MTYAQVGGNVKMNYKEKVVEDVDWVDLTENMG